MRILLTCLLSIFFFMPLRGQDITESFIDSLYTNDYGKALGLRAVQTINYTLNFVENLDTVVYFRSGEELVYFYEGQRLAVPSYPTTGNETVSIYFNNGHGSFSASIRILETIMKDVKAEVIVQVLINFQSNRAIVKHQVNDLLNGRYRELTLDGKPLIEGYYTQIDSTWQDTVLHINPITYDAENSLVIRDKFAVKVGRWLYYNEQGDTIKIENYPEID